MSDLTTLLAELDATVEKMTPLPWKHDGSDDSEAIIALVNAYPQLREGIAAEKREKLEWMSSAAKAMAENERLRALVAQQREALRGFVEADGVVCSWCEGFPHHQRCPVLAARAVLATEGDDHA